MQGAVTNPARVGAPRQGRRSARQRDFLVGAADAVVVGRGEPRRDLARRAGFAEPVALHRVHAGGAQEQMLLGGFDAFGGDLHAQSAAEADDGVDDRGGVRRFFDQRTKLESILSLSNGKRRR